MAKWRNRPLAILAAGMLLGLTAGVGMLIGALATLHFYQPAPTVEIPPVLQATATHGTDGFVIATGSVSDGIEGVFVLDSLTGLLQCLVINPSTRGLGGLFKHNVIADLGVEQGRAPDYLMVTGNVGFRGVSNQTRLSDCVIYIMDANTGNFAAYAIPWNRSMLSANQPQTGTFGLLFAGQARNVTLRE